MKEFLIQAFGEGRDLTWWQMTDRAIVVSLIALVYIRIAGRRSFGMRSAFDNTMTILLGAIMSRAIAGVSPFIPTMAACLAIVLMHRALAWLCLHSHAFGVLIKGSQKPLYQNGRFNLRNMRRGLMSEHDILEDVRLKANLDNMSEVESAWLERSGEVSVVKKKED